MTKEGRAGARAKPSTELLRLPTTDRRATQPSSRASLLWMAARATLPSPLLIGAVVGDTANSSDVGPAAAAAGGEG